MTRYPPPRRFDGTPQRWPLAAGTTLSRVHHDRFDSTSFNPVPGDVLYGGGRFDSTTDDPHGFLYAALDDGPALAETLMRDVPGDDRGYRFLPKSHWKGRELSRVTTTVALNLVALRTGADLGAIGQDTWLTNCGADEYPQTRDWCRWLRQKDRSAHGAAWLSKRDPGETVLVLWGDRCPPGALIAAASPLPTGCRFDAPAGAEWLRNELIKYRVTIRI